MQHRPYGSPLPFYLTICLAPSSRWRSPAHCSPRLPAPFADTILRFAMAPTAANLCALSCPAHRVRLYHQRTPGVAEGVSRRREETVGLTPMDAHPPPLPFPLRRQEPLRQQPERQRALAARTAHRADISVSPRSSPTPASKPWQDRGWEGTEGGGAKGEARASYLPASSACITVPP